jgi:hypothetical protein
MLGKRKERMCFEKTRRDSISLINFGGIGILYMVLCLRLRTARPIRSDSVDMGIVAFEGVSRVQRRQQPIFANCGKLSLHGLGIVSTPYLARGVDCRWCRIRPYLVGLAARPNRNSATLGANAQTLNCDWGSPEVTQPCQTGMCEGHVEEEVVFIWFDAVIPVSKPGCNGPNCRTSNSFHEALSTAAEYSEPMTPTAQAPCLALHFRV